MKYLETGLYFSIYIYYNISIEYQYFINIVRYMISTLYLLKETNK